VVALVPGSVSAQGTQGDRVGAALGREVAAESEHVSPGDQAKVFQAREFAETEALGDEAAGMLADRQVGQLFGRAEAAVEGAGAFRGLGGVLGDVRCDPGVGQLPRGSDRLGVGLASPGQGAGRGTRCGRVCRSMVLWRIWPGQDCLPLRAFVWLLAS
jgi:hypothetical protein